MLWLLVTCLSLTALLLLALAVPIGFAFRLESHQVARAQVEWLFGLVRVDLPTARDETERAQRKARAEERRRKAAQAREGQEQPRSRTGAKAWRMLRSRHVPRELGRAALRALSAVEIEHLDLDVWFGVDDPAETATLYGFSQAVLAALPLGPSTRVSVYPDFSGADLHGEGDGRIRFVPLKLLAAALGLVLSPPVMRAALRA